MHKNCVCVRVCVRQNMHRISLRSSFVFINKLASPSAQQQSFSLSLSLSLSLFVCLFVVCRSLFICFVVVVVVTVAFDVLNVIGGLWLLASSNSLGQQQQQHCRKGREQGKGRGRVSLRIFHMAYPILAATAVGQ